MHMYIHSDRLVPSKGSEQNMHMEVHILQSCMGSTGRVILLSGLRFDDGATLSAHLPTWKCSLTMLMLSNHSFLQS